MQIKVYTSASCQWSEKLKDWLERNSVTYDEIDVGKDVNEAKKLIKETGQMNIPVIKVNDTWMIGYDEGRLKKLLEL